MRTWAAITLGAFYTRTLRVSQQQAIIDRPPYNLVRHPGYAGLLLLEIGAGMAVDNWLVLTTVLFVGLRSRLYRIQAEEQMLINSLAEQYQAYRERTWKLIPLIY